MGYWKRVALCAGLAIAIGPSTVLGQPAERPWKPITDERLLNPLDGDWASYRRTYDVTGFSPLRQINMANVGQLRPVWSYSMRDNSRWFPTPIVVNGLMYVAEGSGRVVAFDSATGDVVWIHERKYPADISASQAYGRARGVSVYGDLVYWGTADAHLLALDARTGKLVWDVQTGDYHTGEGHDHPPLIADGLVFLGHAGGDRTAKGRFRAYDAKTGKLVWTVYTAPRPGDPGYDTWSHSRFPPLGAAPWNTASFDPKLGLVYFGSGQAGPWVGALRGPGDALYSNSILAVDAKTGKIRWHFQVLPDDDWDRESAFESMLVDLTINGRKRHALIETGKIGWGVVLDRETGEFLKAFRTAHETVITGWTKEGKAIVNPAMVVTPADVGSGKVFEICPHLHGSRNLNSPSFSPLTRLYYTGINNSCMDGKVTDVEMVEGHNLTGSDGAPKRVPGYNYVGEFVGLNPVTGKRAWTYRAPGGPAMTASALATAGGIVFGGTVDRQFFALDAKTGKLLWQTRLNGDISGAPVTFEQNGREYVAIAAGGRPGMTTSFAALTNAHLAEGSGVVWVFALPDKRDMLPSARAGVAAIMSTSGPVKMAQNAAAPAPPGAAAGPGLFTAAQAAHGEQVFQQSCASCHAVADQTGASFRSKWSHGALASLFNVISNSMPENAPGSLSKTDYAAIMAFMLQHSGYPAGSSDLPADAAALAKIRLETPASEGRAD